jgi:hypothetical protein
MQMRYLIRLRRRKPSDSWKTKNKSAARHLTFQFETWRDVYGGASVRPESERSLAVTLKAKREKGGIDEARKKFFGKRFHFLN